MALGKVTVSTTKTQGLSMCLLAAVTAWPGTLNAQQSEFDPLSFDCMGIRREGGLLELLEGLGSPSFTLTKFSCIARSCVHHDRIAGEDGTDSELFRHIYLLEGDREYISTLTVWGPDSVTPEMHRSRTYTLHNCFSISPDPELWTLDMGTIRYEDGEVHATPLQNYRVGYYYAPKRLLGDWSDATAIIFEKKCSGGYGYLPAYFEEIHGDVALRNGSMRASYEIPEHCTGEWREFRAPLDGPGWKLEGGAISLADVLENVTAFQIRAEYEKGADTSAIRNVRID